jgi:serine/threonine protein kinase
VIIPKSVLNLAFPGKIKSEFAGNSGKVYLVENNATVPKYIAYKSCKELSEHSLELFKEEVLKWNSINSRYTVPIYYIHLIYGEYYACMRACDGSLEDFLKEEISEVAAFNYSLQIIKGLMDLNSSSIKHHQDFNPQNILFEDLSRNFVGFPPDNIDSSHRYRMMISDFAMSNYYLKDQIAGKSGGKFPFKAPEQYKESKISGFSPDKFSLGVLLCLLFSKKHPCGHLASQVLKRNPKKLKTSWETWAKEGQRKIDVSNLKLKNLILRLLSVEPLCRPSYEECFSSIKELYEDEYKSDFETSMFYINYFDKQHMDWPREELKVRVN